MAGLIISRSIHLKEGQLMSFRLVSRSSVELPRSIVVPFKNGNPRNLIRSRIVNSLQTNFIIYPTTPAVPAVLQTPAVPAVLIEFFKRDVPAIIPIILILEATILLMFGIKRLNSDVWKLLFEAAVKKFTEVSVVKIHFWLCLYFVMVENRLFKNGWLKLGEIHSKLYGENHSVNGKETISAEKKSSTAVNEPVPAVKESPTEVVLEDKCYLKIKSMLSELGLERYEENFRKNLLTDNTLLLLKECDLKQAEIPLGPSKLIVHHIKRNKKNLVQLMEKDPGVM